MALLKYTTEVGADRTVAEIEKALALAGAQAVMKEFDPGTKLPVALSFRLETAQGVISFRLPARIDSAVKVLNRQAAAGKVPRNLQNNREQATRIAWRIVRELLLCQLAMIELEQAESTEMLLGFAQTPDGRTLFEVMKLKKFDLLALGPPKS